MNEGSLWLHTPSLSVSFFLNCKAEYRLRHRYSA